MSSLSWSRFRGDAARTAAVPVSLPQGTPQLCWEIEVPTPGWLRHDALVAAGDLILSAGDDELVAVGLTDGALRYRVPLASPPVGDIVGPEVSRNMALVGFESDGIPVLAAFDVRSGRRCWELPVEDGFVPPAIVDETVFLVLGDKCCALDLSSGAVKWTSDLSQFCSGIPLAYNDGRLLVSGYTRSPDNHVTSEIRAIDTETGRLLWVYEGYDVFICASLANGVAILVNERWLDAVDSTTGHLLWSGTDASQYFYSCVAVLDGLVVVGNENRVGGYRLQDGEPQFKLDLKNDSACGPTLTTDAVVVPNGSVIEAFRLPSLRPIFRLEFPHRIPCTPVILPGWLVACDEENHLRGYTTGILPAGNL